MDGLILAAVCSGAVALGAAALICVKCNGARRRRGLLCTALLFVAATGVILLLPWLMAATGAAAPDRLPTAIALPTAIGIIALGLRLGGVYRVSDSRATAVAGELAVVIIAAVLLECSLFNYTAYAAALQREPSVTVDVLSPAVSEGFSPELRATADSASLEYYDIASSADYISITLQPAARRQVFTMSLYIKDAAGAANYTEVYRGYVDATGRPQYFNAAVSDKGGLDALKITLIGGNGVQITGISCGGAAPIVFSAFRLYAILLIAAIVLLIRHYRLYEVRLRLGSAKHWAALGVAFFVAAGLSVGLLAGAIAQKSTCSTPYPLTGAVSSYSPYLQQYDAFQKGQLNIDVEFEDKLPTLNNPYDFGERAERGVQYLFDRCYYEGNYYSYYGTTPLFLVYYPYCALTGSLPGEEIVCGIFALAIIAVCFVFVIALGRRLCGGRPNFLMTLLSIAALIFGSGVYLLQLEANFYSIPKLSSLLFVLLFWLCSLKLHGRLHPLWATAAALCVVLGVGSRPTCIILMAVAAPLYISILANRNISLRRRLGCVAAFALPLAVGAAAIGWYNLARFGSITEFGARYQLTVNDISNNDISLRLLLPSLLHYLLQPYTLLGDFPFISGSFSYLGSYSRYVYSAFSHGALMIPACALGALSPLLGRARQRKNPRLRWTLRLCVLLTLLFCFVSFCIGGTIISYIYEITPLLLLAAIITAFGLSPRQRTAYGAVAAAMLLSVLLCVAVGCSQGTLQKVLPSLFMALSNAFSF